jgi:ATP/maltotriose-dependent transcriptional regulator MalT
MVGRRDPCAAYDILLEALRQSDDPLVRAPLAGQLGGIAMLLGREAETVPVIAAILAGLSAGTAPELRAQVESALLLTGWNNRSSTPAVRDLVAGWEPDGHTPAERELLAVRALVSAMRGGPLEDAAGLARSAVGFEQATLTCTYGLAGHVLAMADATDEAVRAMDRAISAGKDRAKSWTLMMLLTMRSRVLGWSGDLAGAAADAATAVELTRDRPWRNHAAPRSVLAAALAQQGDLEGAADALADLPGGSVIDDATVLMTRASIAAFGGELEAALTHLLACGAMLDAAGVRHPVLAPWWLDAACLLVELDRRAEALELVERGEAIAAAWGSASSRGLAQLARGAVTEGPDGVAALAAAVRTLGGVPGRWYLVRAETLLGEALLRAGDAKGARQHLRRAVDLSVRAGYRRLTEQTRAALVAAGGRMYQVTGSTMDVLTNGEWRVVDLAVTGATNQEIADTLLITLRTVEIHLTSVYRKLVVTGRAELRSALHNNNAEQYRAG